MKHLHHQHKGPPARFESVVQRLCGLRQEDVSLIIEIGGAYLGKHRCKDPQQLVNSGQHVEVYYRLPLVKESVVFDRNWILEDSRDLLVAVKPRGLPTQGRRDSDSTAFYELIKQQVSGYVGLHHRLDQDTSGLMVFTRSQAVNRDLARAFADRLISKDYLAVCQGANPFTGETEMIDAPIAAKRGPKGTRHQVDRQGKPAQTRVRVLHSCGDLHLVHAQPLTGRTHQIRVHLSSKGLPLLGDQHYGGGEGGFLLHCCRLRWDRVGALPANEFCQPPEGWLPRLGKDIHSQFQSWWRDLC